ncbi:hypothetical protein CHLRE_06g282400v5 [Chlamydomonas reinhardtii]|uniref:Uncharacterized protein n=1 Tax=Chlamydomonas reinhardtii TaxID=3055 RepID=A0A2K3DPQ6_CHLRE|nr:uncharacterized protein CHLRE_06g282400v5 [Chlamydomonas reinhardtii]PNW82525.1 hypothetical protein CHLRE_06g282400v5 [Chlamydomonas reinhardtii]
MRHLEQELGVRFVAAGGEGDEDEEEELDDWEDVVAELGNPLDMRPARVGLMDDDLEFGLDPAEEMAAAVAAANGDDDDDGRLPLPPLPASAAAAAAAAAAVGTGASGSSSSSSSSGTSAYLDPSALTRVGRGELLQLAAHGGSAPDKAAVALLDVREAAEVAAAAAAAAPLADGSSSTSDSSASPGGCSGTGGGGCGGGGGGGCSSSATSLAPWGSRQQHVVVRHVALSELRRPQAEALAAAADYVAVAATADHRGEQAVVRLGKVYGLRRVVLYDEAEE